MNYPNAEKGIKKIFLGEILFFLGAALAIGLMILLAANHIDLKGTGEAFRQQARAAGMIVPFVFYTVGTLVLFVVGLILTLAGITQASRDEDSFKRALWAAVICIIVSIASSVLAQKNTALGKWMEVAETICTMMVTLLVLDGIGRIAGSIGNKEVSGLSQSCSRIILYPFIASAVVELAVAVFDLNQTAVSLFSVVISVLDVISSVLYLRVLAKARVMR